MPRFAIALILFLFSQSAYSVTITQIESYLNSLHNVTADFVQIDTKGQQQQGKFFLSRPGKMRWQYETPRRTLLIINDKSLIYYDQQLDQVSYFKNKEDHLSWLTGKTINLGKLNAKLEQAGKDLYLTIPKTKQRGEIRLIFSKSNLKLIGFEMMEDGKDHLLINFMNLKESAAIDEKLFQFHSKERSRQSK